MKILTSIVITITVLIIFLLTLYLYIQYKATEQADANSATPTAVIEP
ncbi:hypothetical protein IPM65_04570 [Candidatus Roizmanbacteria bacterium]|nr:MAG: hypothetical protein IPM65_04570 [Candidatus Roizmanbacteria bacterium]